MTSIRYSVMTLVAAATVASVAAHAVAASRWQKIDQTPGFQNYRRELQRRVNEDGRTGRNVLWVVARIIAPGKPYSSRDGDTVVAYVYWPGRHQIITLGQTIGDVDAMSNVGQPLDLRHDVVKSHDDIGGSTYLVTRAWVANVIRHCRRDGEKVILTRR